MSNNPTVFNFFFNKVDQFKIVKNILFLRQTGRKKDENIQRDTQIGMQKGTAQKKEPHPLQAGR